MDKILLSLVSDPAADPWLAAVAADYAVPSPARVYAGPGLHGERVAFWLRADGGGFGAVDGDPEGYVRFSAAMAAALALPEGSAEREAASSAACTSGLHGGVEEYEFEPGTFSAKELRSRVLDVDAETRFGGI